MQERILITGCSSGIGYATAKYFLNNQDCIVFGTIRTASQSSRLIEELGPNFIPVILDVQDEQSIAQAREIITEKCENKGLNLLINNAGISVPGPLKELGNQDFETQMDVNVNGVVRVTNAFLPLLGGEFDSSLPPGRIINISSVSGIFNTPMLGAYCVSKHALESLTDIYRMELSIYKIKVISIQPGPIISEIWNKAKTLEDKYLNTDYRRLWKSMAKMVAKSEENALSAEVLAKKIFHVYKKKKPSARYIVDKKKFTKWFMAYVLPNFIMDYFISRLLKKVLVR